jgi:hypothetical protein
MSTAERETTLSLSQMPLRKGSWRSITARRVSSARSKEGWRWGRILRP